MDYTLQQTANDELALTYTPAFLKRCEWSESSIGADITLISSDGRQFNTTASIKLEANTPPPKPTAVLAQTNSASPTYVLCLQVPDMGVSVTGGLLHKDIEQIEINGTSYPLTVSGGDFVKPSDAHFITAVTQLVGYPAPPAGAWVLYYDTGLSVGNAYQAYTVKLKDNKGLVSAVLNTGTARPQPPAETVTIARGQQGAGSGSGTSVGSPIIINGETSAPEAQITIQNIAGTTVHCTVQEVVGGSATGTVSPYDGNPVNVPLGLDTANEKIYEVKYHTDGEGYTQTSTTTKYYKVLKCHSVTFDANGGTFTDGSTTSTSRTVLVPHNTAAAAPSGSSNVPTQTGYHVDGWYTEAACTTQWNFSTQMITGNITLYAKWAPNSGTSYRVEHYKEDLTENQYTSPPQTENPTGTTGASISVTPKTYQGFQYDRQDPASATIAADGSTVVKVYYKRKTVNVTFNPNGGTIDSSTANVTLSGRFGAVLTPPSPVKTGYHLNPSGEWNPVSSAPALGSSPYTFPAANGTYQANWVPNTYKVKFNSNGGSGYMSDQTFTYGTAQYLKPNTFSKTGHDFLGWSKNSGATTATYTNQQSVQNLAESGTVDLYAVWKLKTYKVRFCVEGGKGSLTASGQTATDSTLKEISVNHGSSVSFNATPTTGWNIADWSVSSGGTLSDSAASLSRTLSNVTADRTVKVTFYTKNLTHDNATWKDLLNAVKYAPSGSTLTIDGEIKATTAPGNHGEIKINKNLTIKEIDSPGFDTIINANNLSRIFNIESGTLTMERLYLQNGKSSDNGAGIFVNNGASLELKNSCVIKDCVSSANGGGIYMAGTGSVLLEDSVINKCIAKKGGGVYVPNGNTFKMKGRSAISIDCNDDSDKDKNAVYLENTAKINISAGNNGYAVGGSMIVRIIPQSYSVREVLTGALADGNPKNHTRFMVKPNSQYWFVDNTGKLSNNTSSFFNDAYKDLIKSHEPLMKPARIPGRTELLNKMLLYKTSEGNFGIMQITQANSATGPIMFNYKTYNSYGNPLMSNDNITVNGTYDFDLDTGLGTGRVDFWLQNVTSTEVYLTPKNGAQFYLMP